MYITSIIKLKGTPVSAIYFVHRNDVSIVTTEMIAVNCHILTFDYNYITSISTFVFRTSRTLKII